MLLPSITLELVAVLGSLAEWTAKISYFTTQSAFSSHTSKQKLSVAKVCSYKQTARSRCCRKRKGYSFNYIKQSEPGKQMQRLRIRSDYCDFCALTWRMQSPYFKQHTQMYCCRISDLKSQAQYFWAKQDIATSILTLQPHRCPR